MAKRKVSIEVDIDDNNVNSIEDLECEILMQDVFGKIAKKYLESLQDDMAQEATSRKGSKKVHIKASRFEFTFQAKRTIDENGKKRS